MFCKEMSSEVVDRFGLLPSSLLFSRDDEVSRRGRSGLRGEGPRLVVKESLFRSTAIDDRRMLIRVCRRSVTYVGFKWFNLGDKNNDLHWVHKSQLNSTKLAY